MEDMKVQALAREVAQHLDRFSYVEPEDPHVGRLVGDSGQVIHLGRTRQQGGSPRLEVEGRYPDDGTEFFSEFGRHSITVSADRAPEAIARDIARRLLPRYGEAFARVAERLADREREEAERGAVLDRLEVYVERPRRSARQPGELTGLLSGGTGTVRVRAHNFDGLAVDVELSDLSPEQAETALAGLGGRRECRD